MELDVGRLKEMHPLLHPNRARELAWYAAMGLERNQHLPGVALAVHLNKRRRDGNIHWPVAGGAGVPQLDFHRVTEEAAEAIALTVVFAANGWTVLRRMQRGDFADWLLMDVEGTEIALEVSGVDTVDTGQRRLKLKVEQVRQSLPEMKMACVVELRPPRCRTRMV